MNRPYYALAMLVALLGGSAVAVGPARCHSATAGAAVSSRSLCSSSACNLVVAANLLTHFESGLDAGGSAQGSDDNAAPDYDDSCGYDPDRGETYDAEVSGDDAQSSGSASSDKTAGTFADDGGANSSEERIDAGYRAFERCDAPAACGGEELHCPYLGGQFVQPLPRCEFADEFGCDAASEDSVCQEEYQRWLAEQEACEAYAAGVAIADAPNATGDKASDAWKTAPVETPDWIAEYLNACMPSLEEQYAEAEMLAALEAESNYQPNTADATLEYGPELPESPAPAPAEYRDEYESLYDLDAYLADTKEIAEDESEELGGDDGQIVWSLVRVFGKLFDIFDEILPMLEDDAEELLESADDALQQWNSVAEQLVIQACEEGPIAGVYGENIDDAIYSSDDIIISNDEQIVVISEPALPVETAESRELLATLAGGLRAAGQLLLSAADGLEAEAERVLSAQYESDWSR